MTTNRSFDKELELATHALGNAFSPRALAWQVGGTMVAGMSFAIANWLSEGTSPAEGFVLNCIGFVVAYVILWATGCMVTSVIRGSVGGEDARGVAPLHFLVDNLATAMVLPLFVGTCAALAAAVTCAPAALWFSAAWQGVLVVPAVVVFAAAAFAVGALFGLLFIVPAMVVAERPHLSDAFRRIVRLFHRRKVAVIRLFGVGFAVAVLVVVPVLAVVLGASHVLSWIYRTAAGDTFTTFVRFMLRLFSGVLLWGPVLALPLVFLNALSLAAYPGIADGLDFEEEPAKEPPPEEPEGTEPAEADKEAPADDAPEEEDVEPEGADDEAAEDDASDKDAAEPKT